MNILSLCRLPALLVALGALLALAGPAHAADPALQIETTPKLPQLAALKSLPSHGKLRVNKLQIDSNSGETVDAELQRIEVFMPGAEIIVHGNKGERRSLPPPDTVYFGGKIVGEDDSQVFLAIDGDGATRQIVHRQGSTAVGERKSPNGPQLGALTARTLDPKNDFAHRSFECGASKLTPSFGSRVGALNSSMSYAQLSTATPPTGALTTTQYDVPVVIETDYEYFTKFGSEAAASKYVADLFAYINTAYTSEIRATPKLVKVNIYSTPSDPWTATLADAALYQLRDQWSYVSSPVRAAVHFMSGKTLSGSPYSKSGLAYIGALCINNDGMGGGAYGVSGGIDGSFNPSAPGVVWDALVVAHELGHNFGSYHTFEFDALQNSQNWEGNSSPVDCCYPSGYAGGYCTSANQALPGVGSLSGGPPGVGAGTIMSYCHLMSPGDSNTTLTFGTNHPYGVAAYRVPNAMRRHVEAAQASYPGCITASSTSPTNFTLSVSKAGTGSGTVTSSPAGINCGSDCSESYTSGTSVTLTATPASGSTFAGWSGACSGTGSCTVTMSAARSVTATFNTSSSGGNTLSPGQSVQASVGVGEWKDYSLVASKSGQITIWLRKQSGDADLYVRKGNQLPQMSVNDCASENSSGLTERCSLPVAAGETVRIAAYGYEASSFILQTVLTDPPLTSNQGYVSQLYLDLLWRSPTATELSAAASRLNSGQTNRAALAAEILNSTEFQNNIGPIARLYSAYFRRVPDLAGWQYYMERLYPTAGSPQVNFPSISLSFSLSPEFQATYGSLTDAQFVELVYNNVLARAPENGAVDYYLKQIQQEGRTRGQIMLQFSESPEYRAQRLNAVNLVAAYLGLHETNVSADVINAHIADITAGRTTLSGVISGLLSSPAYSSRF